MVNMALKKDSRSKMAEPCCEDEHGPRYPWGLQVSFETEQLETLGITSLPKVGETMTLTAVVKVTSCGEREQEDGLARDMTVQITDMALGKKGPVDMGQAAEKMYRKE